MRYLPVVDDENDLPPRALDQSAKSMTYIASGAITLMLLLGLFMLASRLFAPVALLPLVPAGLSIWFVQIVEGMARDRVDRRGVAALVGLTQFLLLAGWFVWNIVRLVHVSGGAVSYVLTLLTVLALSFPLRALLLLRHPELRRWLAAAPAGPARRRGAVPPSQGLGAPRSKGASRRGYDPRGPIR